MCTGVCHRDKARPTGTPSLPSPTFCGRGSAAAGGWRDEWVRCPWRFAWWCVYHAVCLCEDQTPLSRARWRPGLSLLIYSMSRAPHIALGARPGPCRGSLRGPAVSAPLGGRAHECLCLPVHVCAVSNVGVKSSGPCGSPRPGLCRARPCVHPSARARAGNHAAALPASRALARCLAGSVALSLARSASPLGLCRGGGVGAPAGEGRLLHSCGRGGIRASVTGLQKRPAAAPGPRQASRCPPGPAGMGTG